MLRAATTVLGSSVVVAGLAALGCTAGWGGVPVRIGIVHPPSNLRSRENLLGYRAPVVGGLYYTFDTSWARYPADRVPAAGRELVVCWMPKIATGVLALADIPAGRHDRHIDAMLTGMRSFDGPVVCRWGHEPNGDWYPWCAAYPRGRSAPEQYVTAWRYIVARERRMPGPSNIRWFWCPTGRDVGGVAMERYWPGEDWVDIVGCDVFNEPQEWKSFNEIVADPYRRITSLSDKQFWIGETGCHEPLQWQRGTKAQWIADMAETRSFPRMRTICYFDYDARPAGRADWRFDSTRETLAAVREILGRAKGV